MKKNIVLGMLVFLTINVMGVQSAKAQNPVKKQDTVVSTKPEKKTEEEAKKTATPASTNNIDTKSKPHDCCAPKGTSDSEKKNKKDNDNKKE